MLGCIQQAGRTLPEEGVVAGGISPGVSKGPVEKKTETFPKDMLTRGRFFKIDPAASEVIIYTYRSGRLARLGYNHLLVSKDVEGTIVLGTPVTESWAEVKIPVKTLIVDDPEYRKKAGPEFKSQPPQSDIEETRRNLLGSRILDAENYPLVTVNAKVVSGDFPDVVLDLDVEIRKTRRHLRISAKLEKQADRIIVHGNFTFRQTDFGIEPLRLLKGALTVNDEIKVQYWVVARPSK